MDAPIDVNEEANVPGISRSRIAYSLFKILWLTRKLDSSKGNFVTHNFQIYGRLNVSRLVLQLFLTNPLKCLILPPV